MRAGELRNKVVIQQVTETQGTDGYPSQSWSIFATVWAAIEPLQGRELNAVQQIYAEVTGKIRTRYLAGVTPKMRALFGSRVFDILGAINVEERNRELIIYTKEVV